MRTCQGFYLGERCNNALPTDSAPHRKYCSPACRQAAYRVRRNQRNVTIITMVADLTNKVDHLTNKLEQLTLPGLAPAGANTMQSARLGTTKPKSDADIFGDLEIKKAKSKTNGVFNLKLNSIMLGAARVDEMSTEILEYGVTDAYEGGASKQAMQAELDRRKQSSPRIRGELEGGKTNKPAGGNGPKAMDVPDIAPPSFDDLELEFDL